MDPTMFNKILSNVGIAIINHPPFITISTGGIPTINSMGGANGIATYPHYIVILYIIHILSIDYP